MKVHSLLFIILIVFVVTTGCEKPQKKTAAGDSVKIGIIGPMSGPNGEGGRNSLAGIRTALKVQPTLDNGSLVKIVIEDDQNKPALARKALLKLVKKDAVSAVIIISHSKVVLSLVESAENLKIPILAVTATHPDVTKNNSYISQLLFDDDFQASVAALYVRDELLAKRAGVVINKTNPHSQYLANQFINKFTSTGGICIELSVNSRDKKLLAELKSLQNQGIDFLYAPLNAKHVVTIARLLKQTDYHPIMLGSDGLQSMLRLQHQKNISLINGMLATDSYSTTLTPTDYGEEIIPQFRKSFSTPDTVLAAEGAEGISIMLSAINRCPEKSDRSCINQKLRSTGNFTGILGKISINAKGKAERPIFINTIDNGKLKNVVKVY